MIYPAIERRTRRSEQPGLALQYQIEHALREAGLKALVLADDEGLPVAAAGDPEVYSELAAVAPWAGPPPGRTLPAALEGVGLAVRSFFARGASLHLAALGDAAGCDAALAGSLAGVERILAGG